MLSFPEDQQMVLCLCRISLPIRFHDNGQDLYRLQKKQEVPENSHPVSASLSSFNSGFVMIAATRPIVTEPDSPEITLSSPFIGEL